MTTEMGPSWGHVGAQNHTGTIKMGIQIRMPVRTRENGGRNLVRGRAGAWLAARGSQNGPGSWFPDIYRYDTCAWTPNKVFMRLGKSRQV